MSIQRFVLMVGVAGLAFAAAPASAQRVNDVRCLVASNLFAKGAKEAKAKQIAEAASYFYLGRIDGRFDANALKKQVTAQRKTITQANASSVMMECFRVLQQSARTVENASR